MGGNKRVRARCTVTAADPGDRFAFDVRRIGSRSPIIPAGIAWWEYPLEPVEGCTRVIGSWTDNRRGRPDAVAAVFDKTVTGGRLGADFQRGTTARTLANRKLDVEG